MIITIESDRECTVDGVGLLEPGKPVVVDPEMFRLYHNRTPAQANFPVFVRVVYELEQDEEETVAIQEEEEEEEQEDADDGRDA